MTLYALILYLCGIAWMTIFLLCLLQIGSELSKIRRTLGNRLGVKR